MGAGQESNLPVSPPRSGVEDALDGSRQQDATHDVAQPPRPVSTPTRALCKGKVPEIVSLGSDSESEAVHMMTPKQSVPATLKGSLPSIIFRTAEALVANMAPLESCYYKAIPDHSLFDTPIGNASPCLYCVLQFPF